MTARPPVTVELAPDVSTLLSRLGGTAEDVARSLRAAGIRGLPRNPHHCPLAQLLRRAGFSTVHVGAPSVWLGEGVPMVDMPEACSSFVGRFDTGCYPDLVGP